MNQKARNILCGSELIQLRDGHFQQMEQLSQKDSESGPCRLWGIHGRSSVDAYLEPEQWVDECLHDVSAQADKIRDPHCFRPLVVEHELFGVRFIDRIFGAKIYKTSEGWWGEGLDTPIGQLEMPDIDSDNTWRLAQRVIAAFAAQEVTLPLFGLPTLSSALNTAINLYGDRFLVALLEDPDGARHDLEVINGLILELHARYIQAIPEPQRQPVIGYHRTQPPGRGQLCGCSTHLLSAEQYRTLVADLDDQLLSLYPGGGMIHLCGAHARHIPVWREMASLKAVQTNDRASDDVEQYWRGLRDDQVIYFSPTATTSLEQTLKLTNGRRLVIVGEPPASPSRTPD